MRRRAKAETRKPGDRPASRLRARDGRGAPAQRERDPQAAFAPPERSRRARFHAAGGLVMRRVLLATAAIAFPLIAYAQDDTTNLPDEVVTATRVPTLIDQIPAGVTVIDRATIDDPRLHHARRCAGARCRGCTSCNRVARAATPACSSAAPIPTRCWCCATACRSTIRRTRTAPTISASIRWATSTASR